MPYPKLLAFVEGRMERIFLNNNFSYITVIPVSNGVSWTTDALTRQILTLYKASNFYGDGVFVWVDREKRSETAGYIEHSIRQALVSEGLPSEQAHILICDRMVENLLLADEFLIRSIIGSQDYSYQHEGLAGKSALKSLLVNAGEHYHETTTGVRLLKQLRLREGMYCSPTIERFLSNLQIPCWWLGNREQA